MILSATMMLRHLGYVVRHGLILIILTLSSRSLDSIANSIASATFDVINAGEVRTADMGGE
jgi:isocitrate dehydrogenase (NAD+)